MVIGWWVGGSGCGVKSGRFWKVVAIDVAACRWARRSRCANAVSREDVIFAVLVVGSIWLVQV